MADATTRVEVPHVQGAPPEEREIAEKVMAHVLSFEDGMGREFREKCNQRYRQYRGFNQFRDNWVKAGANDRDGLLHDAKQTWGAHLHIPLSFRTIETMVPRAIAQRPRMLVLPRGEQWEQNVTPVRLLIDAQQDQIDIDLPFQAVMRAGRIYGLGVGKSYWRKEQALRRGIKRQMFRPRSYLPNADMHSVTVFDDPMFEDVDVFDLGWDPYGSDPRTCQWMYHRVWMSTAQVMARIQSGVWDTQSAQSLTEADVRGRGGGQKYDEIWQERMIASGFSTYTMGQRGEQPHEIIEWHDGHQVRTILDRTVLVQDAESACVGEMSFQVYRPTPLQKQMVGIGDLEPLEHIQRELDTLRSQRRDAATLALAGGYAYDENAINEDDIEFGPNAAIPVRNAVPNQALMPLQIRDVPGSGYQEEQVIRTDFDVVSGIQDGLDNSPGGSAGTATEAQLMQAALGRRIELSSRRFEIEVVRGACRCFLRMDQRMILEQRAAIRQPVHGVDPEEAAAEGRWQWFPIGPAQLQGEFTIVPEGGSMDARIPSSTIDFLKKVIDPNLVDYAVRQAQAQDPQIAQDGPTSQDVGSMMGDQQPVPA